LPLLLNATFTTGIVIGRQAVGWLAVINIGVSVSGTVLIFLLAGVLGLGVWGALFAFVAVAAIQAPAFLVAAIRATRSVPAVGAVSYRDLLRYGLPLYPGSLTSFFGYRADVYLLAGLLAQPSAPLGYYSMAVSMAELVFFLPNAVSTFFFPQVAGAAREQSDRQVAIVSRTTLLVTATVGLALVPVASGAILLLLPAFTPSLPALFVLLPGVVAISVTKVVSGYVAGLGLTGRTSVVNVLAFLVNVVLNLLLIPRYGIIGAALASLVSYTLSSIVYSVMAARLAGARARDFWLPRSTDVKFAVATTTGLVRRLVGSMTRHA
jgi:O-antigen/teichoic acid export membrane protein